MNKYRLVQEWSKEKEEFILYLKKRFLFTPIFFQVYRDEFYFSRMICFKTIEDAKDYVLTNLKKY